jgi:hypothetical protein
VPSSARQVLRRYTTFKRASQSRPDVRQHRGIGIKPRENHVFRFDETKILSCITQHKEYIKGGVSLTGLPKFDDLRPYDISKTAEADIYKLEVKRLKQAAESDEPILFNSGGVLESTNLKGYENVSHLADQILCNFSIILHDNSLPTLEYCKWMSTLRLSISDFKKARRRLMTRYEQDEDLIKARKPKLVGTADENSKAYFAIVDYITATIARLLVRSATSDYWNHQLLAVLAQWAAKLKVVSFDPVQYSSLSLSAAEELVSRLIEYDSKDNAQVLKIRLSDAKEFNSPETHLDVDAEANADITGFYYQEHTRLRAHLAYLVEHIAGALFASEKTGNLANSFETCSIVYETGLDKSLTLLSGYRNGDVSASSDRTYIQLSYTAFDLLIKIVETLEKKQTPSSVGQDGTTIDWSWNQHDSSSHAKNGHFRTTNLDDIVSMVVCGSLIDVDTAVEVMELIRSASNATEEEDPIVQFAPKSFHAKFTVTTAEWAKKDHRLTSLQQNYNDPDIVSITKGPLDKRIRGMLS